MLNLLKLNAWPLAGNGKRGFNSGDRFNSRTGKSLSLDNPDNGPTDGRSGKKFCGPIYEQQDRLNIPFKPDPFPDQETQEFLAPKIGFDKKTIGR